MRTVAKGHLVSTFVGSGSGVQALSKLHGGRLASGHSNGAVQVWNVPTGERVLTFVGHSSHVYALAQLDGGMLVSVSGDGAVKTWMPSGEIDSL